MSKTKIRKFAAPPRHAAPRHSALNAGRVTAVSATIGLVMAGTAIPAAAAQPAGNCSAPTAVGAVTCTYSDPAVGHYVLRIPAGVTDVHVTALGAGGGAGGVLRQDLAPAPGGAGGMTAAAFPVSPGDVLHVLVGGHGENANGTEPGAAGRNGGAAGGTGAPAAGGGGGASSVKLNGTEHHARILVAGGGGGGGGTLSPTAGPVSGGDGGGERGENGGGGYFGPGGLGAQGPIGGAGLDTVIGTDGHDGLDENNGGAGGEGGYATSDRIKHSGTWPGGPVGAGGGGGGYAGGGGGAAGPQAGGGGGGGSGYVAASRLAGIDSVRSLTGGGSKNDGVVVITYQLPTKRAVGSQASAPPAVAPSLAADAARKP